MRRMRRSVLVTAMRRRFWALASTITDDSWGEQPRAPRMLVSGAEFVGDRGDELVLERVSSERWVAEFCSDIALRGRM